MIFKYELANAKNELNKNNRLVHNSGDSNDATANGTNILRGRSQISLEQDILQTIFAYHK